MKKIKGTDWGEDFSGLLDGGDAGPLPLLEELYPGGVVKGGRRVRAEEGGEALAVGQGRWAGAIGQLVNTRKKWEKKKSKAVTTAGRSLGGKGNGETERNTLLKVLQGISSKQTSIKMYSNQDSLVLPLYTVFFDGDWFKQQTTERKASKKTENQRNIPRSHFLIFIHTPSLPPFLPPFSFPPAYQVCR